MPRWDFSNGENNLVVSKSSPTFSTALNSAETVEPAFKAGIWPVTSTVRRQHAYNSESESDSTQTQTHLFNVVLLGHGHGHAVTVTVTVTDRKNMNSTYLF
jgi:hypothetical protein